MIVDALIMQFTAFLWALLPLLLVLHHHSVDCVRIVSITKAQSVKNNTSSVVLDCEFVYSEEMDQRLVLKWFHNSDPQPVYQWIPALSKRHFSPKIAPYLDVKYSVDDRLTRYRAIKLIKPTTELSGQYTCSVSSFNGHDSASTPLIVYTPADRFEFFVSRQPSGVNVTCFADGLYPRPSLALYRYSKEIDSRPVLLTKDTKTVVQGQSGHYSITIASIIREDSLPKEEDVLPFECVLSVEQTTYRITKSLTLQKGWDVSSPNQGNSAVGGSFYGTRHWAALITGIAAVAAAVWPAGRWRFGGHPGSLEGLLLA